MLWCDEKPSSLSDKLHSWLSWELEDREALLHHSCRGNTSEEGSDSNPSTHSPLAQTGYVSLPCGKGVKKCMLGGRNVRYVWAFAASTASVIA